MPLESIQSMMSFESWICLAPMFVKSSHMCMTKRSPIASAMAAMP